MKSQLNLNFSGGINQFIEPENLQDNEAVLLRNLYVAKSGKLIKRPGMNCIFNNALQNGLETFGGFTKFGPVRRVNKFVGDFFVLVLGTEASNSWTIYLMDSNGKDVTPGGTGLTFTGTYEEWPSIVDFNNDTLVLFGGNSVEGYAAIIREGSAVKLKKCSFVFTAGAQTQAESVPVRPRIGTPYQGSMFYGNLGPGFEDCFTFSDDRPNNAIDYVPGLQSDGTYVPISSVIGNDVLSYNGRHVRLGGSDRDEIVAASEILLDTIGTPAQAALLILGQRNGWIATGNFLRSFETPGTGETYSGDFVLRRMNFQCGCMGESTLVRTPMGVFWVGLDEVWYIGTGATMPLRIGTKIRPSIMQVPKNYYQRAAAVYCEGFLRVALPTQQSGLAENGQTDMVRYDHYWLDLRFGVPTDAQQARWFGPMQYCIANLNNNAPTRVGQPFVDDRITSDKQRVLMPAYVTDVSGLVFGVSLSDISSETNTPYDFPFPHLNEAPAWLPETVYAVGDYVRPSYPNGRFYKCTAVTGTEQTGTSDPFSTNANDDVFTDNDVTWTEVSGMFDSIGMMELTQSTEVSEYNSPFVTGEIKTKVFNFGDIGVKKLLEAMEIHGASDGNTVLNTRVLIDGGAIIQTGFSNQNFEKPLGDTFISNNVRVIRSTATEQLGSIIMGSQQLYDTHTVKAINPITTSNNRRYTGKEFQFSFVDLARYLGISGHLGGVGVARVAEDGSVQDYGSYTISPNQYTAQSLAQAVAATIQQACVDMGVSCTVSVTNAWDLTVGRYNIEFVLSAASVPATDGANSDRIALVFGTPNTVLPANATAQAFSESKRTFTTLGFDTGISLGTPCPHTTGVGAQSPLDVVNGLFPYSLTTTGVSGGIASDVVMKFYSSRTIPFKFATKTKFDKILTRFRVLGRRTTTGNQT